MEPLGYMYNWENRVVFAASPKVMSSSILYLLDGLANNGSLRDPSVPLLRIHVNRTGNLPPEQQDHILSRSTRVAFVRNPFTRVHSAWVNKFELLAEFGCWRTDGGKEKCFPDVGVFSPVGRRMLEYAGEVVPKRPLEVLRRVTWPIFLRGILEGNITDMHWNLQVSHTVYVLSLCDAYACV